MTTRARRTLLACVASAAACVGLGAPVAEAYPPAPRVVTATPSTGLPSYTVAVTSSCTPGESVTFELADAVAHAICRESATDGLIRPDDDFRGLASVDLDTPSTPGDYRGTVTGTSTAGTGSFTITVVPAVIDGASQLDIITPTDVDVGDTLTWWPILLAMGGIMVFAVYRFQGPLRLTPQR